MALVYEECGNCRRRGAYLVADRGVVRCKYCAAAEKCKRFHPSSLGAVAARLQPVDSSPRSGRRGSSWNPGFPEGEKRIPGGVMSMDRATISVLAGGATRHHSSYPPAKSASAVVSPARSRDLTAVIVDDDPVIRSLVAAVLKRSGMIVSQAGSGEEGCATIIANPPDLVVLDLSMPGMDGLEVLVELKRRCDSGVIVLSGRSSEGDRVVARELGADDYVTKPFTPADLMSRVEAVIAARAPERATAATG